MNLESSFIDLSQSRLQLMLSPLSRKCARCRLLINRWRSGVLAFRLELEMEREREREMRDLEFIEKLKQDMELKPPGEQLLH